MTEPNTFDLVYDASVGSGIVNACVEDSPYSVPVTTSPVQMQQFITRLEEVHGSEALTRSALRTLEYIRHACGTGIFVFIHEGSLLAFIPLWISMDYRPRNTRHESLWPKEVVQAVEEYAEPKYGMNLLRDQWFYNSGIICNLEQYRSAQWQQSHLLRYKGLFETIAPSIGSRMFVLNKRDHAIASIGTGLVDPYHFIYGSLKESPPLTGVSWHRESASAADMLPILSFYGSKDHVDRLIPGPEDWASFADDRKYTYHNLLTRGLWRKRARMAVFRGSATGQGKTADTNTRIWLWQLSRRHPKHLDVELTSKGNRHMVLWGGKVVPAWDVDPAIEEGAKKEHRLSYYHQASMFRYVIYADGHAGASRLGQLLRLPMLTIIFKDDVDVPCPNSWTYERLQETPDCIFEWTKDGPGELNEDEWCVMHVRGREALIPAITWCKEHDKEVHTAIVRAMKWSDHHLDAKAMYEGMISALWS